MKSEKIQPIPEGKNMRAVSRRMTDDVLHLETLEVAKREKQATYELLEFLHEVDRRRLYSLRGYSSLFVYVRDYLGYGERQAFERVAAMRLVFKVEEVKTALQDGRLNLTTTAQLAVHVRRKKLTAAQTRELLPEIEARSKREIERIFEPTKLKTIRLEIDDECERLLERFKELEGNPAMTPSDCLKSALKRSIAIKEKKNTGAYNNRRGDAPAIEIADVPSLVPAQVQTRLRSRSRYILKSAREAIIARAHHQCEYVDLKTDRRCDGRHSLQFDHVTPFALGGKTIETNLQLLCAAHNRLRAIQSYGEQVMRQWIE